jgi:subtilisin family serine protease
LNANRDLYLITGSGHRDDQQLLDEIKSDASAGSPALNGIVHLIGGSDHQVKLDGGTTASVLNGGTTASVLNGWINYYGTRAPQQYVDQPAVGQIQAGSDAHAMATGRGVVIAEVDNGVDPFNPVLRHSLLRARGYNFYDGTPDWSAYSDVCLSGGTTASVLNGGTTASVLNGGTTASVLNGGTTASVLNGLLGWWLNGGTTASVLNGGTTASVLNCLTGGTTASVLNGGTTASVLNGGTTASVLNGEKPLLYVLDGGTTASVLNGGTTASVLNGGTTASVLNGVPCLAGGTTASVLNGGTTASVLNGGTTASVLNGNELTAVYVLDGGTTASVLNGGTTASVLNGGTTASVLNGGTTASVLNGLAQLIACNPDFGHGTAVAGLLHLVAPNAKILPIKAFGANGEADAATIYQAITYAIDQRADVINLSFSATDTTDDIRSAINEASQDGIVVVAAAGNSSSSAAVFPASLPGVVGVGAVDGTAANTTFPIASFSNFDPGAGQFVNVDVAAPGVDLFTTYPGFGLLWAKATGTSFSAPLVAGEAALLKQLGQDGGANEQAINSTANPSISGDQQGQLGYGLVNVAGALTPVAGGAHPHPFADSHAALFNLLLSSFGR